jgi:hypothetical protein
LALQMVSQFSPSLRRLLPTSISFKTCSSCSARSDGWNLGSDVFSASKAQLSTPATATELLDVLETKLIVLQTR